MANITPSSPVPFSDVYQLETTDLVLGGPGQVANRQAQSLVNRTQYLKDKFENDYAPKVITANATLPISDLSNYSVEGSGLSISINDYTKSGFKIRILVDNDTSITYTDSTEETVTETFTAGSLTELTWNGTYWEHTNPFTISTTQTLNPKFPMSIAIDTDDVVLTLGDGAYVGYELPVLAKAVCSISYTGEDGATTDELNPSDYITYVWQGSYWLVDASTYDKPVVISTTQSIAPTKKMSLIIDTTDVVLTLLSGLYPTFELPILAQANCTVRRLTSNGWVADSLVPSDYATYIWDGTYWLPRTPISVLGVDDNNVAFGFNIDEMVKAGETAHIQGTDANGNSFEYGIENLITKCEEQSYSTTEVKTNMTWIDGKPIYRKCYYVDSISYILGEAGYVVGTMPNNLGNVVKYGGCCRDGLGGAWLSIPYSINTWNGSSVVVNRSVNPYVDVNSNQVKLDIASNMPSTFYYIFIVLEYTKTTD